MTNEENTIHTSESVFDPSTGLLGKLGIQPQLLQAQFVNFAIVMAILYFFVYKKLLAAMDKREQLITQGIKDAESSKELRRTAEVEKAKMVAEARREAGAILADIEAKAAEERRLAVERTQAEVEAILRRGKEEVERERAKATEEVKAEMGQLLAYAMEKLAGEKLDHKTDAAKIAAAIAHADKRL